MLRLICPICQLAFERDKIESHIEEQHMDVVESQTETIEANDQSNEDFEEAGFSTNELNEFFAV